MDVGDIIEGRYRVRAELGRGSFGTTYAAQALYPEMAGLPRGVDEVAIKALDLRRVDDWKAVELFEREARVLANLDHPRIPKYVEFLPIAEHHTGYLVQALAPGRSLAARLESGQRFDESEIREIAAQLLDVLLYLGELSPPVIHRDIKPGNVLLSDAGEAFLVDFGSVRDVVEGTVSGGSTIAGTFGYMAPEQLHGAATPSGDLYGLGMTLVHLLTGVEPTQLPRSRLRVDFHHLVSVSDALVRVLDRLIEPVPEDRYPSARAAIAALEGAAESSGLSPLAPTPSLAALAHGGEGELSADAIARTVTQKRRAAEDAERQALARQEQRILDIDRRASRRVSITEDAQGLTLRIAPTPLALRFLVQEIGPLFLTANPGFAIAGAAPFLGPAWPIFANNVGMRFVVWSLFLHLLSLLIAYLRASPLHVRVAGQHFIAWRRNPKSPLVAGTLDQLRLYASEPGDNGYGSVSVSMDDESESFMRLAKTDLDAVRALQQRLQEQDC